MRFAISLPQTVQSGSFDPTAMDTFLTHAEELGFDSAWTGEQVLGTQPLLSPLETLAYAAARTRRIRLGCAMLVGPLHNPVHLAKTVASVDQLSQGRLEIGLVAGGPNRMFSAFGVDPAGHVARFGEGLRLMEQLWTRPRVDFDGRFWQLRDAAMEPKPVQQPHPPVWFGGSHPNALARAVRSAHGFIGAGSSTTAAFARHAEIARDQLRRQQRDPSSFTLAKRVYVAVDNDGDKAREWIADALERRYGYFGLTGLAAVPVAGTVDDCAAGLREVVAAGAQLLLLNPLFDELGQMHRLAAEVLPRLA
ncbi:LLM class flavin-dependent oxidoreductase [Amycolatopsis circi]|uniref:LLM class flavin-dependent oxidoreductase n=1 Tax=Amycolatopsis circi TaxID=871959 RepID=UPI000E23504D|nr:LLM class flavin-dependent oxidoreductase [Amycolatopsis circi]